MRTQERLKQATERIARALDRARVARQKLIYGKRLEEIQAEITSVIDALEGK